MASFSTQVTLSAELLQCFVLKQIKHLHTVDNPAIAPLPVHHSFSDYVYRRKLTLQLMYSAEMSIAMSTVTSQVSEDVLDSTSPFLPPLRAASVWLVCAIYRVDQRHEAHMATFESIFVHI